MLKKSLYIGWISASLLLFLYSFTQVDLGLTLTRASFWQIIHKSFQYIGYYNRPLSTYIFTFLILLLFTLYLLTLKYINNGILKRKDIWIIVLIVSGFLFFSYNAFSYDLFNYIFDAKIVTYYNQNPYEHRAIEYIGDPMLGFMHWTHRLYPYGPFWLIATIPLSFLGFGFFLPTLYLFKLLSLISFLGSIYFIEKILEKTKIVNPLFGLSFFALNPLILIEALVSSHNDIFMVFLAVVSLYFLLEKKYSLSFPFLVLSIATKFATAFIMPSYLLYILSKDKKKLFYSISALMIIPVIIASFRTNYEPWYFINFLIFAAFLSNKYYIFIPSLIFSFASLLKYIPFLYTGNWNEPIPKILFQINLTAIIISLLLVFIYPFLKSKIKSTVAVEKVNT